MRVVADPRTRCLVSGERVEDEAVGIGDQRLGAADLRAADDLGTDEAPADGEERPGRRLGPLVEAARNESTEDDHV